ncbi:zinc finger protein 462-like [Pseudochaenichthys georgianus]|uniref:zinc finger protein 462-like n=1 Tax=Pseudochaenichthys georgianus TaxID=52239 RepID=UPI00146E3EDA|nr:zinc finger protein 462-like [Pseudochaenichthys georgianus]
MQQDSTHFSSSGHMKENPVISQETTTKSVQCRHCTVHFKSKVYLFKHLKHVHGYDVEGALREADLKNPGTNNANVDYNSTNTEDDFECQQCDFKALDLDVLKSHEKHCQIKTEDQNVIGNVIISENPGAEISEVSKKARGDAAVGASEIPSCLSVMSTSKSKPTLNTSKDRKTYKRQLQTITKYFVAASGSNGKTTVKLAESAKLPECTTTTIILQESPPSSSPNSSGVFKVNAKSIIDLNRVSQQFLLNDHFLSTDLKQPKPMVQSRDMVPDKGGQRTNNERSRSPPAKKSKTNKEKTKLSEKANTSQQIPSSNTEFSFDVSEDEGENKHHCVNGNTDNSLVYLCKHCEYRDVGITNVSTHYQNNHPYVRYNVAYIKDRSDASATFRCLQCPVEFLSVANLKKHYTENHPEAPNVFKMHSHELSLVFKCFVCLFTTNMLESLIKHFKENHPTHRLDNSLMYCRYSATGCQEGSYQSNTIDKASSPGREEEIPPESACTASKEVQNAPLPQHPTPNRADVILYHCNTCKFSHKSVVVMHVHYQKIHPGEEVSIDKIKQSSRIPSSTTSQMTPDKSPNPLTITEKAAPQTNISDSSEQTKDKAEPSQNMHPTNASKTNLESPKVEKQESVEEARKRSPTKRYSEMDSLSCSSPNILFYCQFCGYSSTKIKSVVGHHNAKHSLQALTCIEEILSHSVAVRKKKRQSEAESPGSTKSSKTKTCQQAEVYSETAPHIEYDEAGHAYACAENLFYCQNCNYGNPSAKGVANHQNQLHRGLTYDKECILQHTALIRDEIEKSKSQAKEFAFSTHLPQPLMKKGDEDMFFCHYCNYRQRTVQSVLRHYSRKHSGFIITGKQVRLYTTIVCEKAQKSDLKANRSQEVNLAEVKNNKKKRKKMICKSVSVSSPASQTQRTLQCHRCTYTTQYVCVLKRHMGNIHETKCTVSNVLKLCYEQGDLQTGYHCDMCVFSHKNAAAVFEHHKEQHPGRKRSLEYVIDRLYVGPKREPKRQKAQEKCTDDIPEGNDSVLSKISGHNDTYSCRACSFKGGSLLVIAQHYRDVHPWSVKEDGSVMDAAKSKRQSANRQMEDDNEMPGTLESYQVPLEFDMPPVSPPKATASSEILRCPYCPAKFNKPHGLSVHCGMKHYEAVNENQEEKQEQSETHKHVFKCPYCTYVNTGFKGVQTHFQMRHPTLKVRADNFHLDIAQLANWDDCLKINGPGNPGNLKIRGYMCQTCPHICSTVERLKRHCKREHTETEEKPPKPSAVSKIKPFKTLANRLPVSKISFLCKKKYAVNKCQYCTYHSSTKIAIDRHVRVHHKKASVLKVQDGVYKCELCTNSYFTKPLLGSHYIHKHGRSSFLKYCAPVYKKGPEKPEPHQPENTDEACKSGTIEENNKLIYRCPTCPYVNSSYHGTLTHCQMRHPNILARADNLPTDVVATNMVGPTVGQNSNVKGYLCEMCPLIFASMKKLKIHCVRDHDGAEPTTSEHSAEKQPDQGSNVLVCTSLKSNTPAVSATEMGSRDQLNTQETCQSVQNKQKVWKCHMCSYEAIYRRYLQTHYKKRHKYDPLTTHKLLEKYNCTISNASILPVAESEEPTPTECKKCPELTFLSPQLLLAHYDTFHSSDCLDFIVLSQGTKKGSTGLYRCVHCNKLMNGTRKLWYHLDCHRVRAKPSNKTTSPDTMTTPAATSLKLGGQDNLLMLEPVEDLAQWNVRPVQTLTLPQSPLSPSPNQADVEMPQMESSEHACKLCRRTFMSLKGLRSHERSHAAVAAIKKQDHLLHGIDKYVQIKAGTVRPYLCSFCPYRTTVMGLWRSHFMKIHKGVILDSDESDNEEEESAQVTGKELLSSSEELNCWPESDGKPGIPKKSLYLEPPDVQRQLNHYSSMAKTNESHKQEAMLPNSLLHCEFCNFNTEHRSSIRRHYVNRHGKKIFRCKDCEFFTGVKKTFEMHMERGHSTCQSLPTHDKDLRCPFCLYQTKNKNNMIDHIILHREERVVPIEVCRSKLSRCLQGIVFRCHKCTFTSGSAENLNLHMTRHDDIKPYKCRLCYFDCIQLSDLEAHLSDKHQVVRNHELVGQVSLDQLEARVGKMPEEEQEPSSNLEHQSNESDDAETDECVTGSNEGPHKTQVKELTENEVRDEVKPQTEAVVFSPAQPVLGESEDNCTMFRQLKELMTLGSSTKYAKIPAKTQDCKPHNEAPQEKAFGSTCTTKTDENTESEVVDKVQRETVLLGETSGKSLANDPQNQTNAEASSAVCIVSPKCEQLKISNKESLDVSLTNDKNQQVHKNIVETRDPYEDMPVLEKEYLKEEMQPLGCFKAKDQSDHLQQKQDKTDETIADDENRCKDEKHEQGDGRKEDPYVPKEGDADALRPAATEEQPFTCQLCGRNLMNSSELQRHILRHGI